MIGGEDAQVDNLNLIWTSIAPGPGDIERTPAAPAPTHQKSRVGCCGPHGAGHFVKMVHNGIEYAIAQCLRRRTEHPEERRCRKGEARSGCRDRAARAPRVLPVRHGPHQDLRGLASWIGRWILVARPDSHCAVRVTNPRRIQVAAFRTPVKAVGRASPQSKKAFPPTC